MGNSDQQLLRELKKRRELNANAPALYRQFARTRIDGLRIAGAGSHHYQPTVGDQMCDLNGVLDDLCLHLIDDTWSHALPDAACARELGFSADPLRGAHRAQVGRLTSLPAEPRT